MTLFPQLSESFYVDDDSNVLKLMDYTYAKNIQINQSYWTEADLDLRFVSGDQTLWNDIYGNLPAFRRRQFNFNRMMRVRNMISGYQRQHRKSMVATAIENKNEHGASQFSKLMFHVNNTSDVLHTVSDAFQGAVTCGMNLLNIWMDYRSDPVNGDIRVDNLNYSTYIIDPYFKKRDLSDCNNVWVRRYLSKTQVDQLLPGREFDYKFLKGYGNRDGKFQFMSESYAYAMQDLIIYDEFWYLDSRKQKMLVDVETGECKEWSGQDDDLNEFLRMFPSTIVINQDIPTVKLAIVVQGKVMYHGPNPMGIDKYPFVPVFAYYEPELATYPLRIQGVMRGLRDAQYLYNRRRVIELDILESQITSGYIYRPDDLVNPKDVFLQGQGRGLAIKNTSRPMADSAQPIQPPQVPPSMIQLSELLAKEVSEISGVSEELLGMADDDKAGILSMLRQGANLTTLQILFDNLDAAQKLLGKLEIELMQRNWTPGKVSRILNEEPDAEFYNRAFSQYDCVVEDGLNTSTQRQMQFAQLLQLREMQIPVPADILIEASTLQDKDKLVKALQAGEQQQAEQAKAQHEADIAVLKAQIENLRAQAAANEGLGLERVSRIQENQALAIERRAKAEHDLDLGALEKVRAIKELQSLNLDQIQRAIDIIAVLKGDDRTDETAQQQQSA